MAIITTGHITYKGINIGNHAFCSITYVSNTDIRIIPRAKGVKIWSTEELGGGYLTINVSAIVAKDTRALLEKYFLDMDSTFDLNSPGSLVISDGVTAVTLIDCYLESFDSDNSDLKISTFRLKLIKSL